MKYMLMMNAPRGTGDWGVMKWPAEDLQAHIRFMKDFTKALAAAGELVAAEGLAPPAQARVVRAQANGAPAVTDGPFAEAKEFLAGLLDCRRRQSRARLRDRRGRIGGARQGWTAAQHADRSARGDERAARRGVTTPALDANAENLLRELAPQVLGSTSGASRILPPPRMRCRRRSSPRACNGRRKGSPTIRAGGSFTWPHAA